MGYTVYEQSLFASDHIDWYHKKNKKYGNNKKCTNV